KGQWPGDEPIHSAAKRTEPGPERWTDFDEPIDAEFSLGKQMLGCNAANVGYAVLNRGDADITAGKEEQLDRIINRTAKVCLEPENPRASRGCDSAAVSDHHTLAAR